MQQTNDIELIRKVIRDRDMAAYQIIVQRHQERIYFFVRRIAGTHEDAQDIVQETFLKALRKINQLREVEKFAQWLNNIAMNLALDHNRKRSRNGKYFHTALEDGAPIEGIVHDRDRSINQEAAKRLSDALTKLPVNHREAFMLFHYQQLPVKIVAEFLGCPEATARSYIFRAVQKLRVYLKDYYETSKE